jgi:hypothetical protein
MNIKKCLMILVLLMLTSLTPSFAKKDDKPDRKNHNLLMLKRDAGRMITNFVFYITPEHRRKALKDAEQTTGKAIKPRAWDHSNNFTILATSVSITGSSVLTRTLLEEEAKSISLLSKEGNILCKPLATMSFRLTEEDVDYLSNVYQYHNKGIIIADYAIPPGTNAVVNEYDYRCLEKEKKVRLYVNRKSFKPSKRKMLKWIKEMIKEEMTTKAK